MLLRKEIFIKTKEHIEIVSQHILYITYAITFAWLMFINIGTIATELKLNSNYASLFIGLIFLLITKYIKSPLKICLALSSIMMTIYALSNTKFYNRIDNVLYILLACMLIYIMYLLVQRKNSKNSPKSSYAKTIRDFCITIIAFLIIELCTIGLAYGILYATTRISTIHLNYSLINFSPFITILALLISIKYIRLHIIKSAIILTILGLYITFIAHHSAADSSLTSLPDANMHLIIISRIFSWIYLVIIASYAHHEK